MSWRETLGVPLRPKRPMRTIRRMRKNPSNRLFVRIARILRIGIQDRRAPSCWRRWPTPARDSTSPAEVKEALAAEHIEDWLKGAVSADTLAASARSLEQRHEMDQGKRPDHYAEQASCKHCGPVWLWFSGEVLGCPWCWNRAAEKPIPRPCSVRCGDCIHFERIAHPHLGHCAKSEPEAIAGLWDTDRRYCERFLPRLPQTHLDQPRPASAERKR